VRLVVEQAQQIGVGRAARSGSARAERRGHSGGDKAAQAERRGAERPGRSSAGGWDRVDIGGAQASAR
jgi:hypothetical protein